MQKPAFTVSITQVKPGDTIPPLLLLKLHQENQSAMGLVIQTAAGLEVEKFDERKSVEHEVKETTSILENTKKFHRMLCFCAFPDKFDKAEVQPWIILKDSKEKPILVVACEGDFSDYVNPGEGHSEFYNLVHEHLGPKLESLYKFGGNDPKKLNEFLRSSTFHDELDLLFNERGVFEFMPAEGEPFAYGDNKIGGEFGWGRASNIYGYTEAVQEAATAEAAAPVAEPPRRSKYASDAPEGPVAPTVNPPAADPTKPNADPIAATASALPKKRRIEVPKTLHGKRKKAFIREALGGDLPPTWDSMSYIEVDVETTVNSLADLSKTTAVAEVKDMKATAPTPVASEKAVIPVISGAEQSALTSFIKKYLDGNSNRVENPLEMQKIESKLAVFTEVAGLTTGLDEMDTWTTSVLNTFVKERPDAAWLLILEYRADRRKRRALMLQGDKKLGDLTGTEQPELPTEVITAPASPAPGTVSPPEPEYKKSKYA